MKNHWLERRVRKEADMIKSFLCCFKDLIVHIDARNNLRVELLNVGQDFSRYMYTISRTPMGWTMISSAHNIVLSLGKFGLSSFWMTLEQKTFGIRKMIKP